MNVVTEIANWREAGGVVGLHACPGGAGPCACIFGVTCECGARRLIAGSEVLADRHGPDRCPVCAARRSTALAARVAELEGELGRVAAERDAALALAADGEREAAQAREAADLLGCAAAFDLAAAVRALVDDRDAAEGECAGLRAELDAGHDEARADALREAAGHVDEIGSEEEGRAEIGLTRFATAAAALGFAAARLRERARPAPPVGPAAENPYCRFCGERSAIAADSPDEAAAALRKCHPGESLADDDCRAACARCVGDAIDLVRRLEVACASCEKRFELHPQMVGESERQGIPEWCPECDARRRATVPCPECEAPHEIPERWASKPYACDACTDRIISAIEAPTRYDSTPFS